MINPIITNSNILLGLIFAKKDLGQPAGEFILNSSMHLVQPCFPSGKSKTKLSFFSSEQYIVNLVLLGIPINRSFSEAVHISPSPYSNTIHYNLLNLLLLKRLGLLFHIFLFFLHYIPKFLLLMK